MSFCFIVLGSGTSQGVPIIGKEYPPEFLAEPKNHRTRPSIYVETGQVKLVVDTTPEFRIQMLREKINRLDAVLFTHAHADHIMGLDDVRPFNFRQRNVIPIYGSEDTLQAIRTSFRYIFQENSGAQTAIPKLETHALNGESFDLFGLPITPIPVLHGKATIYGFRFGDAAYLTDHSEIPDSSLDLLHGLDVLFLDALRYKPHPTHSTVERSLQSVEKLAPRRAFFTHICHDLPHERTEADLPPHVRLAYDGLEITAGVSE